MPAVLKEDASEYFELEKPSPYMLLVADVKGSRRNSAKQETKDQSLLQKLYFRRSDVPAVTHVDYSARIQTVDSASNYRFHRMIQKFKELTGYGIVVNTSFNVRGEPVICTPEDADRCFMSTEMDYLAIGNYLLKKQEQSDTKQFKKGAKGED